MTEEMTGILVSEASDNPVRFNKVLDKKNITRENSLLSEIYYHKTHELK